MRADGDRRAQRRLALLCVVVLVAGGVGSMVWLQRDAAHPGRWFGSGPRASAIDPPPAHAERHAPPAPPLFTAFSPAQARAYAAAGLLEDGAIPTLPALDAASQAELPRMRDALASQHALTGAARPTHTSGGTLASTSGQRSDLVAPAQRGGVAEAGRTPTAMNDVSAPGAVTRHLDLAQVGHGVVDTAEGPLLSGDDVWAMVRLDPARGHLRIVDQSAHGYVISLHGDDFATIRLNGGLVVPGRYYQIQGEAEITGATATAVHIRPLSAVSASYATPLLPSGNG